MGLLKNYVVLWAALTLLWAQLAAADDFKPSVVHTNFPRVGSATSYFDDSRNILVLRDKKLYFSGDDGKTWDHALADTIEIFDIIFDPFFKARALALTKGTTHYLTEDKGKTWKSFEIEPFDDESFHIDASPKVSFNYAEQKYVMLDFAACRNSMHGFDCRHKFYYSKDGLKSKALRLNVDAAECVFARSSKTSTVAQKESIYCIQNKVNSHEHVLDSKVVVSDDFFASSHNLKERLATSGRIIGLQVEQNFIIAVVHNDRFSKNSRITIYVSRDGETFFPADLEVEVSQGMLAFLESSSSSLFLSVSGSPSRHDGLFRPQYSTIYSSDSSGVRFTKILDKVEQNAIKKVQTVDGVWLANVMNDDPDGSEDDAPNLIVGSGFNELKSRISFDDGKTWEPLKVDDGDCDFEKGCSLHLFTPSERDGEGNYVTGPTPGILMAVGSTGDHLTKDIKKMKTYISRDSGATWRATLDEPCLFSFGDQGNIITAVPYYGKDDMSTNALYYSLDQGKTWSTFELETSVFPLFLTTTIDGTSKKFLLSGLIDKTPNNQNDFEFDESLFAIDFSQAFGGKTCSSSDMEEIYGRVDQQQKPICVYGHREKFARRKQDAQCLVNKVFEDVKVIDEPCDCSSTDFECAYGFRPNSDKECVADNVNIVKLCKETGKKQLSLPDKILIVGNKCQLGKKSLNDFIVKHDFVCSDYVDGDKGSGNKEKVTSVKLDLEGGIKQYTYIEQGENYDGENIVILTTDGRIFASRTGGTEFVKMPVSDRFIGYYTGSVPGHIVLISRRALYVSTDSGNSYDIREPPATPIDLGARMISFDKDNIDRFIYYGAENCDPSDLNCKLTAYLTNDSGAHFTKLKENVRVCAFISPILKEQENKPKDLIFCEVFDGHKVNLVSSDNNFKDETVLLQDIVGHAITGNFVVVATIEPKSNLLNAKVSVDGKTFADAAFPIDFKVDSKLAYTVLDSETNAIFLHVTTDPAPGHEFGAILKSNSNGTSYVLSLDNVNRNRLGYVDYDRIEGIEGKIIANTVFDPKSKGDKKLKTQITHNDGGEWGYLEPPKKDSEGKRYGCTSKSLTECSLNLHGFTERSDFRDSFSSPSATGLIMAIGNVGKTLGKKEEGDTFLSNDGGLTWKEIRKGAYMWEYGDRGTILALVAYLEPTDKLIYSLNQGDTWHEYKFAEKTVQVQDIATVPSDNSRKFLIFAKEGTGSSVYGIDFTNVYDRQCNLDLDHPDADDFDYWSPTNPMSSDTCLFGHEAKYLRRSEKSTDCFIGSAPLIEGFKITKNCSCTRKDYECDYNYSRDADDTCKLVKGFSPSDHKKEMCKNDAFQFFEPTGYRKIPISTCEGGKQFDSFEPKACPGKEKEFRKFYGQEIGFFKLLLIVGIPLGIFLFATWFVYDRGIRRNGGFSRFGQIRLDGSGEDDFQPVENNEVDKVVNAIVKGGITTAATVIALFKTVIAIDKMMLEKVANRLFGRGPGRRSYVNVPDIDQEEEELFGNFRDNYEEEIEEGVAAQQFSDETDAGPFDETEARNIDADSRLFDIDDEQLEEENRLE